MGILEKIQDIESEWDTRMEAGQVHLELTSYSRNGSE
jgi:hypothetical protein